MLHRALTLSLIAGLLASTAVFADDDKDESGKGRERRWERKDEYWQGDCKIERKWEKNGEYKEERKCGRGEHRSARKEEFWDGNCKVERKWKDGGYKEERKCKGGYAPAAVVYPPWIVMHQGERVYDPRYEPQSVGSAARCNSDTVGRVLGGVVGGALGNQIGKGNGRTAATIGGAVLGVLIGGEVGRRMDANDQACVGQVLEVAPVNHRVRWVDGPAQYAVVPGQVVSRQGSYCRPYTMEMRVDGGPIQRNRGTACRRADGVWVPA
jgi:surface antigen